MVPRRPLATGATRNALTMMARSRYTMTSDPRGERHRRVVRAHRCHLPSRWVVTRAGGDGRLVCCGWWPRSRHGRRDRARAVPPPIPRSISRPGRTTCPGARGASALSSLVTGGRTLRSRKSVARALDRLAVTGDASPGSAAGKSRAAGLCREGRPGARQFSGVVEGGRLLFHQYLLKGVAGTANDRPEAPLFESKRGIVKMPTISKL